MAGIYLFGGYAKNPIILDLNGTQLDSRKLAIVPKDQTTLGLSPGESTHFECCLEILAGKPCEVQVEVNAQARTHGAWFASAISLPVYSGIAA